MRHAAALTCLLLAQVAATAALAADRTISAQPAMFFGGTEAKASGDTIDLMGPGGRYPYRGDFETAAARPSGAGLLPDGWTSVDETNPGNHWHVDAVGNPFTGHAAWCGDLSYDACGTGDVAGGYGNNWRDILEFRRTVGAVTAPTSVRVQASLQFDCEPGYDYTTLQRRTAAQPNFEPVAGGQGLTWDGAGTAIVDYTFTWLPSELVAGTDVALAFVFDSDGAWSDSDCLWPTNGAARLDNLTVTLNGTSYTEDFEDGVIGPDWVATPGVGVGDYARVWGVLGDADDCASNYSKLVAFIDDGVVVPGTGGTVGAPGNDYGPPGGYIVNNTGGLLGPAYHLQASVYSPVMTWPDPAKSGMTFAFDIYRHELLVPNDSPGIFYIWSIRSAMAEQDIDFAGWRDRAFVYYGGPNYLRSVYVVDDLIEPNPVACQVMLGVYELGWQFGYGNGTNGTPAPYFDNVSVKVYRTAGPRIAVTEIRLANDGFPAIGDLDLANLGANSVRFDMAANIAARTHLRNDPGDSIWIDVTPRHGGELVGMAVMYWTLAVRNPLFDPYRALPANPVTGRVTRTATGAVVANRFNFDLPDTGLLFPGDVLQYYFAATDNLAGDVRTAYAPQDRAGFGSPDPLAWPGAYTVNCLPSVRDVHGRQPPVLFWNDFGFRGGEDEWYGALRALCLQKGVYVDIYSTHGPSSGVGNGLGGRATVSQIDGYSELLYASGDLGSPTLSNGDFTGDPGNDLGLLDGWLALGGRDLFLTGDDLASSLYASGTAGRAFLETRMGVTYNDPDVRDNIGGQVAPLVVRTAANPVFYTASSWIAYGGCAGLNDFDNVVPFGGATRLAQFTTWDGVSTPYPFAAAILNYDGTNRVVSLNHDLMFVMSAAKSSDEPAAKSPAPSAARVRILSNVLDYFGVPNYPADCGVDVLPEIVRQFAVTSYPNPFNPAVTLRYTLTRPGRVTVKVFDARGALVRTLLDENVGQTSGEVVWDGSDQAGRGAASGLYFVETRADDQVDVHKVTMLK